MSATWRSARFSAFGSTSVGRQHVRRQAGVGDRLGRRLGSPTSAGRLSWSWSCSLPRTLSFFERVVWAAIQMANADAAPMPTSQANMPSLTGPTPPMPNPPYSGVSSSDCEVGDHVALLVGGEVAVGEVRHVLRAGQHRLVDEAGLDAADLRGVAALGHGAARAGEVVAGGAVGQEDLATADDGLLALLVGHALEAVVGLVGDGRSGAEGGDVRREGGAPPPRCTPAACAAPGRRAGPACPSACTCRRHGRSGRAAPPPGCTSRSLSAEASSTSTRVVRTCSLCFARKRKETRFPRTET